MISLLAPSKNRLPELKRMVESALTMADRPVEIDIVVYMDGEKYDWWHPNVRLYQSNGEVLSELWNMCAEKASGPIYMMANDDIVFRTQGWDTKVYQAFEKYPDKIALIFGHDGDPNDAKNFGPHPFVHQNWIDAVGRYLPPYFSGDFVDTWLDELAEGVGRKEQIDIFVEHLHPAFGKREMDDTDKQKWEKHWNDDMPQKFIDTRPERLTEIKKLQEAIDVRTAQ